MDLTKTELKEWVFHPATINFVELLTKRRNDHLEQLGSNYYKDPESIQRTIGICQSLLATIDAIQSYKEVEDEQI